MKNITIINNIQTVVVWVKEHSKQISAFTITVGIIAIIRFFILDIPQIANNIEMRVERDNIYLTQFETGPKLIPLNVDGQEVPPIVPVVANQSTTIRYAIVQDNKNTPQITAIIVTFPNDAIVVPDSWRGLTWERNNDVANRYGLSISPFEVLTKGSPYCLPALHVTFKHTGLIPFSYQINVNKMDPIRRAFTINTASDYNAELHKREYLWANEVNPATYKTSFFKHGDDGQSVSASTCVQAYHSASTPTVSASTVRTIKEK